MDQQTGSPPFVHCYVLRWIGCLYLPTTPWWVILWFVQREQLEWLGWNVVSTHNARHFGTSRAVWCCSNAFCPWWTDVGLMSATVRPCFPGSIASCRVRQILWEVRWLVDALPGIPMLDSWSMVLNIGNFFSHFFFGDPWSSEGSFWRPRSFSSYFLRKFRFLVLDFLFDPLTLHFLDVYAETTKDRVWWQSSLHLSTPSCQSGLPTHVDFHPERRGWLDVSWGMDWQCSCHLQRKSWNSLLKLEVLFSSKKGFVLAWFWTGENIWKLTCEDVWKHMKTYDLKEIDHLVTSLYFCNFDPEQNSGHLSNDCDALWLRSTSQLCTSRRGIFVSSRRLSTDRSRWSVWSSMCSIRLCCWWTLTIHLPLGDVGWGVGEHRDLQMSVQWDWINP